MNRDQKIGYWILFIIGWGLVSLDVVTIGYWTLKFGTIKGAFLIRLVLEIAIARSLMRGNSVVRVMLCVLLLAGIVFAIVAVPNNLVKMLIILFAAVPFLLLVSPYVGSYQRWKKAQILGLIDDSVGSAETINAA